MKTGPFLALEERVEYLYEKSYFPRDSVTEEHKLRLKSLNFHYFLGYARNYRSLDVGKLPLERREPSDVFDMIDMDVRVSALIHEGLRIAEWRLRAAVVECYCSKYPSPGSFLDPAQYMLTDWDSSGRMVMDMLKRIYRHDEPYVDEFLTAAAVANGVTKPRSYEERAHDVCRDLASGLALWTVVDSFTLGLLGRFVMSCDPDEQSPVWKAVAESFEIKAKVFGGRVKSLAYLRNAVAHHSRLWMRPTQDSAKKPLLFEKQLRGVHEKSMYWAFMNLALFMPGGERKEFADRVQALVSKNPLYWDGMTKVQGKSKSSPQL